MEIWNSKNNQTSVHFADNWLHADAPGMMFSVPMDTDADRELFIFHLREKSDYVTSQGVSIMFEDEGPRDNVAIFFDDNRSRMVLFIPYEEYDDANNPDSFVSTLARDVKR